MELDRDAPLFSCSLPVVLRSAPPPPPFVGSSSEQQHYGHQLTTSITCEDRKVELTARVMMSRPCHAMTTSVLHLELTDEQDPCFFYTMQVGEEDYQQLKSEQCLRVDFNSFPSYLIQLLQRCDATAQNTEFVARLQLSPSGSGVGRGLGCLTLVETNAFRELTHLLLRATLGDDTAIKSYLVDRLRQSRSSATASLKMIAELEKELQDGRTAATKAAAELARLREGKERDLLHVRASHIAELAATREEARRAADESNAQHSRAIQEVQYQNRENRASLERRATESESARDQLVDSNFRLEMEVQDLRTKVSAGEIATRELIELREALKNREAIAFESDKDIQRLNLKVSALEQQVKDKQEVANQSLALSKTAEEGKSKLADTLGVYKFNMVALQDKLEDAVHEIQRGNSIIQKLQGEYRNLKNKLKLRSDVVKRQENIITEMKEAVGAAKNEVKAAQAEKRNAEGRMKQLDQELQVSSEKIKESARLLESNQQVIQWLNRELNEVQIRPTVPFTSKGWKSEGKNSSWVSNTPLPPVGQREGATPSYPRTTGVNTYPTSTFTTPSYAGTASTQNATPQSGLSQDAPPSNGRQVAHVGVAC